MISFAGERKPRLLFCSYHCYVDPCSGAAQCTRDLLTLLVLRGWTCGVLCGPHLDSGQSSPLDQVLRAHAVPFAVGQTRVGTLPFSVFQFVWQGVVVSVFDGQASRPPDPPTPDEGAAFLSLLDGILDQFQPDLVLTYGGHWLVWEIITRAKRRGLPVVFGLHNLAYQNAAFFRLVDAVLVPSDFAREHYQHVLGRECTAIPGPWQWERLRCPEVQGRYATFVNPQPHKGLFWFARLADELWHQRPDVPLLVVEGRGRADWLADVGIDFSNRGNLFRMANTPDPRHFYRVSRVVLMPSLCQESFGRVAAESCLNGIPVLASRRGALPEALANAGFLFDVPDRYQPETQLLPSAEEVTPWIETLLRLWDDPGFYALQRQRCLAAAEAWRPEQLLPRFEAFLGGLLRRGAQQAGGPATPDRQGIVWEGPLLARHSLGIVNRQLCLNLLRRGYEVAPFPTGPQEIGTEAVTAPESLRECLQRRLPRPADFHVSHQWPPRLTPPAAGRWTVMQTWEFGSIPLAWVGSLTEAADEIWVYTRFVRDCFVTGGIPADRVHVVPLGVDTDKFSPDAVPLPLRTRKRFKFLFVGATIHRKGFDLLLESYAQTFTRNDDVCLVIKDTGTNGLHRSQTGESGITRLRDTSGAPEVEYLDGLLTEQGMAALYAACDCLVSPYRGEGFGLPIAEAMACGRTVIVTNYGACLDFCDAANAYLIPARPVRLREKRIGDLETVDLPWLVEPDSAALRSLLRRVYEQPEEGRIKGQAGRTRIHNQFTWDHAARTVVRRLEELGQRPPRRCAKID